MSYRSGKCQSCAESFGPSHPNRRYCSARCKQVAENVHRTSQRASAHIAAQSSRAVVLSDADAGWFAGILDGEGTVALATANKRRVPHLRFNLYNSDKAIIDKLGRLLTEAGVDWYVRWDRRAPRPGAVIQVGTDGVLRMYPMLRPHLVRQVDRYDAAVRFLEPRYLDRSRVYWSDDDLAAWQALRAKFNRR